jgi:predicted CXXCH cytochrome family protein
MAAPAFAWTHGQFNATTDACAGCHVAHAAQAPKLLKVGPTQTEFCYLCHADGGVSAPYDIKDGKTTVGGVDYESTGGGFERVWVGPGPNDYAPVTSRHTVWGYQADGVNEAGAWAGQSAQDPIIPGGTSTLTGNGLVCGSCHDPHAGGKTPVNGPISGQVSTYTRSTIIDNPRLLRLSLLGAANLKVRFKVQTVGTFTYGPAGATVDSGVYRVIEYDSGSTRWCGGCHDKFQPDDTNTRSGTGHAEQFMGMWRHPMNMHLKPPTGADMTVASGTPYETYTSWWMVPDPISGRSHMFRTWRVACLTCHKAHGTAARMNGWATNWPRDEGVGGTSGTSALLRMDSRGVCYNCHADGRYNSWQDTRMQAATGRSCGFCHPWPAGTNPNASHPDPPYGCSYCHVTPQV